MSNISESSILSRCNFSVDKIRIEFKGNNEFLQSVVYELNFDSHVKSGISLNISHCHDEFYITGEDDDKRFYIGFNPNWLHNSNMYESVGIFEFNPNKVRNDIYFKKYFNALRSVCGGWVIKRYDLACDIPVERSFVQLIKDQRVYSCLKYSVSNFTEWLGKKNSPGYVKLYNKQLEAKLSKPLTRLELTCDYDWSIDDVNDHFPGLYAIDNFSFDFNIVGVDKVLVWSCLEHPEFLDVLSRRKKEKIKNIISSTLVNVFISSDWFDFVRMILNSFMTIL